jgi:lysophospholipase L1-like esterase
MLPFSIRLLLIYFALSLTVELWAQQPPVTFIDARKLTLIGKAWTSEPYFHRLDTAAFSAIPANVKRLATHSAGLAISFQTNSTTLSAKWCTPSRATSSNMTAIAYRGMDLYIKRDNRWQYAGVASPQSNTCSQASIVEHMAEGYKTCLLFLPTYDETISLEIGIDSGATILPGGNPFRKNILIYGSSITQGASASRPGLAYPARLSRETGYNFINLGFSGSGKMEPAVADLIAPLPMDAYILDCLPNPTPEEILARTSNLVATIRKFHPTVPIIFLQTVAREKGNFDQQVAAIVSLKDRYINQEIEKLQRQDKHVYLINGAGLLGTDQEGTTDGIHPNDLGFDRMLQMIRPAIVKILSRYGI